MADQDLTEYCDRMWPRLVGGLALQCGDRGVAEDLAQETLVRVWQHWDDLAARPSRDGWVWTVAMNLSKSRWRRRAAERRARDRSFETTDEPAVDVAERVAVRRAVAELPERQRAAVVLRYYVGLPIKDVAAAMGCAEGTVGAHTSKALVRLGDILGEDEEVTTDV